MRKLSLVLKAQLFKATVVFLQYAVVVLEHSGLPIPVQIPIVSAIGAAPLINKNKCAFKVPVFISRLLR